MKMIEGASFSAAAKIFFMVFSDYPTSLFKMEEADSAKKVHPDSLANALHIQVLPFPGGPQSRIPLGGARMPVQRSGLCLGRMTASSSIILTSYKPTISVKETSKFLTIASKIAASSISFYNFQFLKIGFFLQSQTYFMWFSWVLFETCSVLFRTKLIELLETGNPNPVGFFAFGSVFCLFLASASAFKVMYFSILPLSCAIVSLDVAFVINYLRMIIILSQQMMAYSQLPQLRKFQAFEDSCLAFSKLYIFIIIKPSKLILKR